MALLSYSEMPTSFTGHALFWAAQTRWLNFRTMPTNSSGAVVMFRGMLTGYALVAYCVGTAILCAPLGILYHGCSALYQKTITLLSGPERKVHANALAWEHLKAMLTDISGVALVVLGGVYVLSQILNPNEGLGWWFSSSQVRTEYAGPLMILRQDDRTSSDTRGFVQHAPLFSGTEQASAEQCSYQKMRVYAIRHWEKEEEILPLNDEEILYNICIGKLEHPNLFQNDRFVPANVDFPSRQYACMNKASQPTYSMHWKTCLKVIGYVALALGCIGFAFYAASFLEFTVIIPTLLVPGTTILKKVAALFVLNVFGVSAGLAMSFAYVLISRMEWQYAKNEWNQPRAITETAFAEAEAQKNNGSSALYWLRQAAHRGHGPAQLALALSLLASVVKRPRTAEEKAEAEQAGTRVRDELVARGVSGEELNCRMVTAVVQHEIQQIDPDDLLMIREALSWLRASGINAERDNYSGGDTFDLLAKLFFSPPDRLFRGISGSTEEERLRSLLEGFGHTAKNFTDAAIVFRKLNFDAIPQAIAASRKQRYDQSIQETTRIDLLDLRRIITEYLVILDRESPFFKTPVPALPNP